MPYLTVKLAPGVNTIATPSQNSAGIVDSQFIRFQQGLVEKLGGWSQIAPPTIGNAVKAFHAWTDLKGVTRLAIGAGQGSVHTYDREQFKTITPRNYPSTVAIDFSTTSGSDEVSIVDANSAVTIYDVVDIITPISVGGVVLFGLYNVAEVVSATEFKVLASANATSTVANGGAAPTFDTTSGSIVVDVTFADHGFEEGDTLAITTATTIGGITLSGFYRVQSVQSSSQFRIFAENKASSTDSGDMAAGMAVFTYWPNNQPEGLHDGYGGGPYGEGEYGVGSTSESKSGTGATGDCTIDSFGGTLIVGMKDGSVFSYSPESNFLGAAIIKSAPTVNRGVLVSPHTQQVIAYGASVLGQQDPLLVRWSDVSNYDEWTASAINQAGSFRLSSGSKIMTAVNLGLSTLLLTDDGAWTMQYVGVDGGVFSFQRVPSAGCGAVSQFCAAKLGGGVYWMGERQFYTYRGSIQVIPCTVRDFVFDTIDRDMIEYVFAAPNSLHNEIAWWFSAVGSIYPDRYVKLNVTDGSWDYGRAERSGWVDKSIFGGPISASWSGHLYEHEDGRNDDASPMVSSFTTGWFTLAEAQVYPFIDQVLPDFTFGGDADTVKITFRVTDEPGAAIREHGPYTVTPARRLISTRMRGRLVSMKVESDSIDTFWRIGAIRFRFAQDGRR